MNQTEVDRTGYDAPVCTSDTDKVYLDALQDPARRIVLIQYLKSHGLLSDPSDRRDE